MARRNIRDLRRSELIDAVIAAIHAHGFVALTVNEIASNAETSTGSIHYYFGSKDALLEATMRHLLSVLRQAVVRRLRGHSDPHRRLHAIVTGNFDKTLFTRQNCSVWTQFWACAPYFPNLDKLQRLNRRRVSSHLSRELRRIVPPERVPALSHSIQSYMDGIWIHAAQSGVRVEAEQAERDAADFLTLAIGGRIGAGGTGGYNGG